MSQTFERAQSRLNNIKTIEPLLSALRTIAMGNWQMAQNKMAAMKDYEKNFNHILMDILPHIDEEKAKHKRQKSSEISTADTIVLIVGSERGLCGSFNETLAENACQWIETQNFSSFKIWGLGSRVIQTLEKRKVSLSWENPLPAGNLISYQQSYLLTQGWLDQYEQYEFDRLFILFNQMDQRATYHFTTFRLLPYEIHHPISVIEHQRKRWPPPIIETDSQGIYHQIIQHYLASSFYQILLRSSAAEHAARFRLMEEAHDNAQEIIGEMNQIINTERKRRITQQTQELAAGAGLLDNK